MVARCPEGWVSRGGTDQCYLIHNNGKDRSFNDARIYCQAHAGDLAIIGSFDMRVSSRFPSVPRCLLQFLMYSYVFRSFPF